MEMRFSFLCKVIWIHFEWQRLPGETCWESSEEVSRLNRNPTAKSLLGTGGRGPWQSPGCELRCGLTHAHLRARMVWTPAEVLSPRVPLQALWGWGWLSGEGVWKVGTFKKKDWNNDFSKWQQEHCQNLKAIPMWYSRMLLGNGPSKMKSITNNRLNRQIRPT